MHESNARNAAGQVCPSGDEASFPLPTPPPPDPVTAPSPAPWRRRLRRLALWVAALLLVGPFLLVLPLAVIQPPVTAVLLQRTWQRWRADQSPAMPRRTVVPREALSPFLRRAVVAAEDDRFYLHWGLDLVEIDRALAAAERGGRLRGASTITQQVAKNLFLWEGRSFVRKGAEAYLTLVLEFCLSKERILDLYLNLAEWGDGIFGAEEAARRYFSTPARALNAEQAARLAAILPAPRRWSPTGSVASRRVETILERMRYAAPGGPSGGTLRRPSPTRTDSATAPAAPAAPAGPAGPAAPTSAMPDSLPVPMIPPDSGTR